MGVAASSLAGAREDRTQSLTVLVVVVAGALLAVAGSVALIAAGGVDGWLSSGAATLSAFALGWGVTALSAARRLPRNRLAWILVAAALTGPAVACLAAESVLTGSVPALAGGVADVPTELAGTVTWLRSIALTASTIGVLLPLTYGFLLFPEGSLPSRRWRAAGLLVGLAVAAQCLAWLAAVQPGGTGVLLDSPAVRLALVTSGLAVLVAVAALVPRLRSGPGVVRQQSKWVAWGTATGAIALAAGIALAGAAGVVIAAVPLVLGVAVLAGAYAMAIQRRWLHEIDLVLSRSVVYAALAAYVVVVSVASLLVAGGLFGGGGDTRMVVAIAATTGIAAGFRPLRERLQVGIERVVSGRTATPEQVLSEFSRRVAANQEDLLSVAARSLVDGTGAVRAQVWLGTGADRIKAAEWPVGPLEVAHDDVGFTVSHGGSELGSLVLDVPAGGWLSFEDRDLAEQVASGIGLALRNGMLAETLERRVDLLRASRRRLIALQDETRRRLERDLHDGAQQQLVALRVKLGLARVMAGRDGATRTGAAIDESASLAEAAIDGLRDLARGVYPPLLETDGLAASIAAEARRAPFPTALRLGGLARYPRDVEATVYLCVVESLREAADAGTADGVSVTVAETDGRLVFEVGARRSPSTGTALARAPGPRLAALGDRVDALSGRLSIGASLDAPGSILAGEIPIGDGMRS